MHVLCPSSLQPLNTMFLHFFVARDELCLAAMNEILRITFTALPQLQYVCLAVPRQAKLGTCVHGHNIAIRAVHACYSVTEVVVKLMV